MAVTTFGDAFVSIDEIPITINVVQITAIFPHAGAPAQTDIELGSGRVVTVNYTYAQVQAKLKDIVQRLIRGQTNFN